MKVGGQMTGVEYIRNLYSQKNNNALYGGCQTDSVSVNSGRNNAYTLHFFDDKEGNTALTATTLKNGSVTVYKPVDYDESEPAYIVKAWDSQGELTETKIMLKEVNPENASYEEMYAYCAYLDETGKTNQAVNAFFISTADMHMTTDNLSKKQDFDALIYQSMTMSALDGNTASYVKLSELSNYMENHPFKQSLKQTGIADSIKSIKPAADNNKIHTPFDKYSTGNKAPYSELADDSGVIVCNKAVFICDYEHNALCLGDMSNEDDVISIPLSGGGTLKVNRNNLEDLASAIGMFSPEDVNRIMRAIAQDNRTKQMQNEIEEEKSSIGKLYD